MTEGGIRRFAAWWGAFGVLVCLAAPLAVGSVCYEDFGAVGDGKADDREAIVRTHEAANQRGESVRATDGKTYYVGGGTACAKVMTDVDFGKAKFVIDDRQPKKIYSPLFRLVPSDQPFPVKGLVRLAKGQADLGLKLKSPCLIHLKNDKVKRYIREGLNRNNGSAQQETILVDAEGRIDPAAPVIWDYDAVTQATAYPVDARTLVVKGGVFVTIANQHESKYDYHNRGFVIERSNVRLEGVRHEVTGELDHGAPYAGFFSFSHCANVVVTGCVFTAHRTYSTIGAAGKPVSMGSYDISANNSINLAFVDCRQTTDILDTRYWGIFGSNYCKNLLYDGCEFSRFDAHMGVANATVRNSRLGHTGINAIGFGRLLVENTTFHGRSFIVLRGDYGSTWNGDFVIRNCRFVPFNGKKSTVPVLVRGSNAERHDFGYACQMPRRILIDGLEIDDAKHPDNYSGPSLFGEFNLKANVPENRGPYPYALTETVTLRNIRTTSGKPLGLGPNQARFKNVHLVRQ